jgi:chaperone required for assembly of F1-ATPase
MRDIFDEIYANQPLDPNEAAQRSMRPNLRKRFFKTAAVAPADSGFAVLLDGRPVRTPARRALTAPTRELAEQLADEWNAQREAIDPAAMPLTRLANAIIDGVVDNTAAVAGEVGNYLGSDLVFYRAEAPDGLVARQVALWDPVVGFAREALGARFMLAQGVVHVAQPAEAVAAARAAIPADPWRLGAVAAVTTLTGSALLALALAHGRLDADGVWAAAHVDEDWQMSQWGRDEIALERRAARLAELRAAATVLWLAG